MSFSSYSCEDTVGDREYLPYIAFEIDGSILTVDRFIARMIQMYDANTAYDYKNPDLQGADFTLDSTLNKLFVL